MNHPPVKAWIESITPLTDTILQIILQPEHYIDYQAGQYLNIIQGDDALSYSIANAPLGSRKYELHLRHCQDNSSNLKLLAEMKAKGEVKIELPFGACHIEKLDAVKPIIFVAGGTGFAPVKAMIEQLLANGDGRQVELYWGARSPSDLYMNERVNQWQSHVSQFRRVILLSNSSRETLASSLLDHHQSDLADWQYVLAGPFDMVYGLRDSLVALGVSTDQLYSDAFDFEENGRK